MDYKKNFIIIYDLLKKIDYFIFIRLILYIYINNDGV
jgi:hypothetical protein